MLPTKKHILKAAKQNMIDDIDKKISAYEETWARLSALRDDLGDDESPAWKKYSAQMCKCNEAKHKLDQQREDLLKVKSRKKSLKKSLEWKQDRTDMRAKVKNAETVTIRDNDALKRVRAAERSRSVMGFGDWLAEGTLVRHRSSQNPLLVLSVKGQIVEVLDGAMSRHYRAKALRPCDMDD
jgi:hypothetical protein